MRVHHLGFNLLGEASPPNNLDPIQRDQLYHYIIGRNTYMWLRHCFWKTIQLNYKSAQCIKHIWTNVMQQFTLIRMAC